MSIFLRAKWIIILTISVNDITITEVIIKLNNSILCKNLTISISTVLIITLVKNIPKNKPKIIPIKVRIIVSLVI